MRSGRELRAEGAGMGLDLLPTRGAGLSGPPSWCRRCRSTRRRLRKAAASCRLLDMCVAMLPDSVPAPPFWASSSRPSEAGEVGDPFDSTPEEPAADSAAIFAEERSSGEATPCEAGSVKTLSPAPEALEEEAAARTPAGREEVVMDVLPAPCPDTRVCLSPWVAQPAPG